MAEFQIGDKVNVVGLVSSDWRGVTGVVVQTIERRTEDGETIQECAVQFPGGKGWFLSQHLARAATEGAVRFLRSEALHRWRELYLDSVATLNGDREELMSLLQERYGFGLKRAGMEADQFLADVRERIRLARELPADSRIPKSKPSAA